MCKTSRYTFPMKKCFCVVCVVCRTPGAYGNNSREFFFVSVCENIFIVCVKFCPNYWGFQKYFIDLLNR